MTVKSAELALHTDFTIDTVDDRIFGGFLEHMGRSIYEGVYDPDSEHADEDGMRIDSLEQTLESLDGDGLLERVKMIYVVSDFDNPRSVSLAVERRKRLVEIAESFSDRQRMLVVEDAANAPPCARATSTRVRRNKRPPSSKRHA